MPKFVVAKAQDAVNIWEKVFEADSIEHANQLADADKYGDGWTEINEHRYFQNCDILADETEELEDEETPIVLTLEGPERDIIIAALRHWQASAIIEEEIYELADNERGRILTDMEIDALIEGKINV